MSRIEGFGSIKDMNDFRKQIKANSVPTKTRKKKNKNEEHKLQDTLLQILNLNGWLAVRLNSGMMKTEAGNYFRAYTIYGAGVSSGLPDIIAFRGNKYLFLEVKKDEKQKLNANQLKFQQYSNAKGLPYYVIYNIDQLQIILKNY